MQESTETTAVGLLFPHLPRQMELEKAGSNPGLRADTLRVMARRQRRRASPSRIYSVYIIELSRACTKQPCALAPLYVGQTAHAPERRFEQHKAGGKLSASKAHKFGVKLRLDLMKGIGPFTTRKEAEVAERAVAEALERRGHR